MKRIMLISMLFMLATPALSSAQPLPPPPPGQPPALPPGAFGLCTMSGATFTGREWAALMPGPGPGLATRLRLGGEAPVSVIHCYDYALRLGLRII